MTRTIKQLYNSVGAERRALNRLVSMADFVDRARQFISGRDGDNAMAFQSVPNTVEIDVIYLLNSITVQNVFYARFGGSYGLSNLQALASAVDAVINVDWLPLQAPEAGYVRTDIRGLDIENDLTASNEDGAGPGELVDTALPNNVTFSVKRASAFTGRSARGRTYWIGIGQAQLNVANENLLDSPYASDVVDAIDAVRVAINGEFNWDAVIVSRISGGFKRSEGVTFDWIDTTSVDLRIDTQRARLP